MVVYNTSRILWITDEGYQSTVKSQKHYGTTLGRSNDELKIKNHKLTKFRCVGSDKKLSRQYLNENRAIIFGNAYFPGMVKITEITFAERNTPGTQNPGP